MKAFNQEVARKIYTFLHYLFIESQQDRDAFLNAMGMMYPGSWDEPSLDGDFVKAVNLFKSMAKRPFPGPSTFPKRATKRKKR
jgi:hypothetical protein